MNVRGAIELLIAAMLGAAITFAAVTIADDHSAKSATRTRTTTVVAEEAPSPKMMDTAGAEELVGDAVEERYGYNPEVACPSEVEARRGYIFKCEALVGGEALVPAWVRVVSDLGFVEVVRVG